MGFIFQAVESVLRAFIFAPLYRTAEGDDKSALDENTTKHARALLKCLAVIPGSVVAIYYGGEKASDIVLYVSLAAQIAGLAWFVISFAALPQRHLNAAMGVTEAMFCAFLSGVFAIMIFALLRATFSLLVIMPIYWWLYKSAAMYDSADLLKAGKDEQEMLAARAIQRLEPLFIRWAQHAGVPPTKGGADDGTHPTV
ncbi:MAG: hypothetical protein UY92_C0010G0027 [Candidatus Magasanikbacteria bacterium GW2011_GWA2_56_11]|uniref:Uncharacterized protein n=1 Tax=Candidatus Magasanikbacteria bacterium GW2011_GWA2_56_11 TaxID=1619044 RepID=A0A0G1YFX5_9BACT|nr:MAG: hypothetical protein UY92_C0010G0027 [Candidatus Magasanikbacteria bacterium GW2011_GWA2_56_11]